MNGTNSTITITFGDVAENHAGMEKIGDLQNSGFTMTELGFIGSYMQQLGQTVEFVDLTIPLRNTIHAQTETSQLSENQRISLQSFSDEAGILIIRKGVDFLLSKSNNPRDGSIMNCNSLLGEISSLSFDTKALMRGRVVNKHARHNLCFGDYYRPSNVENGQGTIISFNDVPNLHSLRWLLQQMCNSLASRCPKLPSKVSRLVAEGNYYYDINKCGIGYHGDSERRIVIGVRLGAAMPLVYQWYLDNKAIGEKLVFNLEHGDIYFMSNKAVGTDWKKRKIPTLRHAAGCAKYTMLN